MSRPNQFENPPSVLLLQSDSSEGNWVWDALEGDEGPTYWVSRETTLDEGLERADRERPDVLVVDVAWGGEEPAEIVERLGEIPRETAGVVLTDGCSERELRALQIGVEESLDKQHANRDLLYRRIDHAIERHRAGRRLTLIQRAVDAAEEGVVVADAQAPDMPLIFVNEGFVELTGYAYEEVYGENCRFLQCEETDEAKIDEIREAIAEEEPVTVEVINERRDGKKFWNELSISPVHDDDGELTHYLGFQRDVTRRVMVERQLREQRRRLERYGTVVENTTDAVVIKDLEGCYELVNEAFQELVGRAESDIIGRTAREVFGEETGGAIRQREQEIVEAGRVRTYEETIASEEGEKTFLTTSIPIREAGEVAGVVGISRDITERKRMEEHLEQLALYDQLTELPNRTLFADRLEQAVERAERRGTPFAVGFLDLDDFKAVNDSFGHAFGDALMRKVARRLEASVRSEDTVARIGGDEFVMLIEAVDQRDVLDLLGGRLRDQFEPPFEVRGEEVHLSASIGFAYPDDEQWESGEFDYEIEALTRTADQAMYEGKSVGGTTWRVFSPSEKDGRSQRIQRANRIRQGIEDGEFVAHFQPICQLAGESLLGFEVLARWERPDEGLVPPVEFIPLAEQSNLICELGEEIVRQAGRAFREGNEGMGGDENLKLFVNLSTRQLEHSRAVERLIATVGEEVPEDLEVCFEVTETGLLEYRADVAKLRDQGFEVLVDDFGTGYSSLSRIKEMPVDGLKLDMEFVHGIGEQEADRAIAETVVQLGKLLDLPVIAEGIETPEQFEALVEMGCEAGQGFYLAKPKAYERLSKG